MNGRMDGWTNHERTNERTKELMNEDKGRRNGWMDGWMNGRHKLIRRKAHMNTNLFSLFSVSLQIRFQVCGKYR